MDYEKIEPFEVSSSTIVKYKESGHVIEISKSDKSLSGGVCSIKKLVDGEYLIIETGEIKKCNFIEKRVQNADSLRRTFGNIRDIVNSNTTDTDKCLFVTTTYKENMTDTKQLYKDQDKFLKKLKYHFKDNPFEYINIVEPQGRGAWHSHYIFVFKDKRPYIDQKWLTKEIWGMGNVNVKKIDGNDNLGAYLTAYLSDVIIDSDYVPSADDVLVVKDVPQSDGSVVSKKILKGGRLHFYPANMRIMRTSRGIKKPVVEFISNEKAQKKVGSAKPTCTKSFRISDNDGFEKSFTKSYYNTKRL